MRLIDTQPWLAVRTRTAITAMWLPPCRAMKVRTSGQTRRSKLQLRQRGILPNSRCQTITRADATASDGAPLRINVAKSGWCQTCDPIVRRAAATGSITSSGRFASVSSRQRVIAIHDLIDIKLLRFSVGATGLSQPPSRTRLWAYFICEE